MLAATVHSTLSITSVQYEFAGYHNVVSFANHLHFVCWKIVADVVAGRAIPLRRRMEWAIRS
jgi:hypothetical protein